MLSSSRLWGPSYHEVSSEIELTSVASRVSVLSQRPTWLQQHFRGWRFGVLTGSFLATLVFAINLSATIYGGVKSIANDNGRRVIFEGNCEEVRKINTGVHFGINILSTLLLSASNYAMQCLSAPTRSEVDAAHEKRNWLDIGVLSVRNIRRISTRRAILWAILAMSSMPLHLFYNSAVYSSVYAADFAIFTATEDMLASNATSEYLGLSNSNTSSDYYYTARRMYASAVANNLTRLDVDACISAYSATFQTTRGSLILVTQNSSFHRVTHDYVNNNGCPRDPVGWMCGTENCYPILGPPCSASQLNSANWKPFDSQVEYCLSEVLEQRCKVQLTPNLAYVVCGFNLVKAIILLYAFFFIRENPLMTIGDAVASFLKKKDHTTKDHCLMGKADVWSWTHPPGGLLARPSPRDINQKPKKWASVISKKRWTVFILLYIAILGICGFLLYLGLASGVDSPANLMRLGLGAVNPMTFISWTLPSSGPTALVLNAFVANSPQPILSTIYYSYNGIFTSFMLGAEWNGYALNRKGLRISTSPRGAQRTSYTLQLPKRIAIPLLVLSTLLHWLCSQSIFLVSLDFDNSALIKTDPNGYPAEFMNYGDEEFVTCGYSPIAITLTISLVVIMVLAPMIVGFRKFRSSAMPVAGSCSASISACCHLPSEESDTADQSSQFNPKKGDGETERLLKHHSLRSQMETRQSTHSMQSWGSGILNPYPTDSKTGYSSAYASHDINQESEFGAEAVLLPVKWGVTNTSVVTATIRAHNGMEFLTQQKVGHCSFSSRDVTEPHEDQLCGYL